MKLSIGDVLIRKDRKGTLIVIDPSIVAGPGGYFKAYRCTNRGGYASPHLLKKVFLRGYKKVKL